MVFGPDPDLSHEQRHRQQGHSSIAGVDEAGRGPLAGPVVAAAVVFPQAMDRHALAGVRDSKQLNEDQRNRFYRTITEQAEAFAVSHASAQEIDLINIRQASLLAMKRAVEMLPALPDCVLVDGRDTPDLACTSEAIIKGDQRSITIGAASILAKVIRDRILDSLHEQYPLYGLNRHKGYPTPYHRTALQLFGPSPVHRLTFGGVKGIPQPPLASEQTRQRVLDIVRTTDADALKRLAEDQPSWDVGEIEAAFIRKTLDARRKELRLLSEERRTTTTARGRDWETVAADWLQEQGYTIWETNFRVQGGEIDLIANHGSLILFVEVKARSSQAFGSAEEALTPAKSRRIIRAAERYLADRSLTSGWDIRYDLVAIHAPPGKTPQVNHVPDAFRVEERLG